jgi:hypothetical protein
VRDRIDVHATPESTGRLFGIRKLGWMAVASMLAIAMFGPAPAS